MVSKFFLNNIRERLSLNLLGCCVLLFTRCATVPQPKPVGTPEEAIKVTISTSSFNPVLKKNIDITIQAPVGYLAKVTMNDAHGLAVRTLFTDTVKAEMKLQWDGMDDSGAVVPDEVYCPVVIAHYKADTITYNPPQFSGGESFTITNAEVNVDNGTIGYTLTQDARIMIRAGEKKGLMLKSIVHCAPRLKGSVSEYWNGKDPDNLLTVKELENWALVIAGYTLPENSIITYGNKNLTYNDYFMARFPDKMTTFEFPTTTRAFMDTLSARGRKTDMHFTYPLVKDHPPALVIDFPNSTDTTAQGIKVLQGLQRVFIDIDPADKLFHRDQQFEMCFFIDGKFVSEDEIGYVPYNWIWNTGEVAEGEHIVTINVSSFKDQIGTKSVRVVVKK